MSRVILPLVAATAMLWGCSGGPSGVVASPPIASHAARPALTHDSTPRYTVVDLTVNLSSGMTAATNGYQVGNSVLGGYRCGRGQRTITRGYVYQGTASSAYMLGGAESTYVYGVGGGIEVGAIQWGGECSWVSHAVAWQGNTGNYVDLNPAMPSAAGGSIARATDGVHEVGNGYDASGYPHALMWAGTAASARHIDPIDTCAIATGVSGDQIVGYGQYCSFSPPQGPDLAYVWVKRVPTILTCQCVSWMANGTDGAQEVGYANIDNSHFAALLWNGPQSQPVDLNPALANWSAAYGVRGGIQVGCASMPGTSGFQYHAALWRGSASSFVDLSRFLPSGYTSSCALAVDGRGDVVGNAVDGAYGQHAILWQRS